MKTLDCPHNLYYLFHDEVESEANVCPPLVHSFIQKLLECIRSLISATWDAPWKPFRVRMAEV